MRRHGLTVEYVRAILAYNPDTGELTWRATKSGRNKRVGTLKPWGKNGKHRRTITIDHVIYQANRIIWLYMTGKWPEGFVDHINRDSLDDRWANLRLATPTINSRNRSKARNNTTGTTGVFFDISKKTNPWRVEVWNTYVGVYPTKKAAQKAARGYRRVANPPYADRNVAP